MKKIFVSFLAIVALCTGLGAQDIVALIEENPDRAANNMHSYEFAELYDTPAPKGFKPFYIEHYGRHGSRYELNSTFGDQAIRTLSHLDSLGLLAQRGKDLLEGIQIVQNEHVGMEGMLTPRGAYEHRQIAARMAERYPEVFKNKDRDEVNCVASTSQRCIISMTNFAYSLKEYFPKQNFNFETGERYMAYINPSLRVYAPGNEPPERPAPPRGDRRPPERPSENAKYEPAPGTPGYDFSEFIKPLVTDFDKAMAEIGNPEPFVRSAYSTAGLCQLLDFLELDLFQYFSAEELAYLWKAGNDSIYRMWAGSLETGENVRWAARPLLLDFIEKADEALKPESHRSADLRFGHDTTVLPLFALLGIDDPQGRRFPAEQAHANGWHAFEQIPMGTNCQFIFYKNKKGEVIAKILYNEKEVSLPGLESDIEPYYSWEDLRAYLMKLYNWE